jgi:hypothetical protein
MFLLPYLVIKSRRLNMSNKIELKEEKSSRLSIRKVTTGRHCSRSWGRLIRRSFIWVNSGNSWGGLCGVLQYGYERPGCGNGRAVAKACQRGDIKASSVPAGRQVPVFQGTYTQLEPVYNDMNRG